jgi:amino acid adenylation domain-containing protein
LAFLLQHLLSESAIKFPNREAIIFKDQILTYAALENESNKLAHTLFSLNIKKGDRVGLFFNRGVESIIAACAVLKVGAAYVPIDPMSPVRRISFIIEKCGIRTLCTVNDNLPKLDPAISDNSQLEFIVLLDRSSSNPPKLNGKIQIIDAYSPSRKTDKKSYDLNVVDTDLAYILFTSGSTGNPKGVMLSHRNSLTFINSTYEFFRITEQDRLSNIAPLHFDMSVFDIFVAFKAGACVVIIPEITAVFPIKLVEYIEEKKITVWNSVPSALSLLATNKNLPAHDLSNLRLILFAGELFPLKYLQILQQAIPGARFCNMYGQTEANSSTYYWIEPSHLTEIKLLPIGKALPNFEVFALDENGSQIQNTDKEGEFYVRASTVALGYWGEPEKTENAFVKNPLRPNLSEKVYKTGDLVRLDANGNYVFLGRRDHMIKSRGYRIEIGEIETVLNNHPEIKNAVVIPIPDELIGNRLSVIIVPVLPGKLTKDDIYKYCFSQLPKYMIPDTIEFRDTVPMTSSGKVDRQKLKG